jgi:hypothetical protein
VKEGEFEAVKMWAIDNDCFVYASLESGAIFVKIDYEDQVEEFVHTWRARGYIVMDDA